MAQFVNMFPVDLANGPALKTLNQMHSANVKANRVGAIVTNNGAPVMLSGTCSGTAILADHTTVVITGVISGNQAYVELPSACYTVEGPIHVFITCTDANGTTTMVAASGYVRATETGTIIDPGTIIPSVAELIQAIEDAVESIPADYSDLLAAIAPVYTDLTFPVSKGQPCWYEGILYKAKQDIASSEAWTAAHWQAAKVGQEVAELKSAFAQLSEDATVPLKGNDHHYYFGGGTNKEIMLANSTTTRVFPISDGKSYHIDITGNMAKTIGFANEEFTTEGVIPTARVLASYTYDFTNSSNYKYLYVYYSTVPNTGDCFVYEKSNLATRAELEQAVESYSNLITQTLSPSKIVEGKILDANGAEVNGNQIDRLCYFDVEPGKTITIYNLVSDGTRHAAGYLNGTFVSLFPAKDAYSSWERFVCTGIDQIGVSLDYTKYTEVYGIYADFSVLTDAAKDEIETSLKYTDAVGNYLPDTIEIGNPANWEGGYIKANGTTITPSDSYKHSDYIQVYGGVDLTLAYIFGAEAKVCHCYDLQKSWIGAIAGSISTQASQTIKTLKNTQYIRVTIQNSPANFSKINIEYTNPVGRNYFVNDLVNGWYDRANKSIDALFAKATAKPILTLIDDDTPTVAAVTHYHDACVANGVVGCYSVITKQLESQTGLADLLLSYEQEGFQSLLHCHNQGSYYDTSSAEYDAAEAEADFVQAIHEILPYNFANWRYWCTPFGSCNAALISIAKKWGMKCLIRSGMLDYETTVPHPGGKYQISRMSLNQNDEALTAIESALDSAALVGGWVLITTHMSQTGWDSAESQQRFADMIAYAKNLGFEIKTVAEALEIREPIYNLYATF